MSPSAASPPTPTWTSPPSRCPSRWRRLPAGWSGPAPSSSRPTRPPSPTIPPRCVIAGLGGRPTSPTARGLWRTAIARIERYRRHRSVEDPRCALGPAPMDPGALAEWQAISEFLARTALAIDRHEHAADLAHADDPQAVVELD